MQYDEHSSNPHLGANALSVDAPAGERDEEVELIFRELDAFCSSTPEPPVKKKVARWIEKRRAAEAARGADRPTDAPTKSGNAESAAADWRRFETEMARRDRQLDFSRREAERKELAGTGSAVPCDEELEALLVEVFGDDYAERPATIASHDDADGAVNASAESLDESASLCDEMKDAAERGASVSQLTTPEPDEPISPEDDIGFEDNEVEEKLQALISGTQHMRWTRDAFQAMRSLKQVRLLARKLSKRVFGVTWQPSSGTGLAEKFPFFIKSISSSCKKGCNAFNEEWELSPQIHPERMIPAPPPTRPGMPAWNKLPALEKRTPELSEVVAGARFTSIAFRGDITPQDWAHAIPGSDVLCMSIDLHGEAAERFLSGEHGDVGKSLKRRLLRRLDHRGRFSDLTVGAVWTKPSPSSCAVRVFLMFQMDDPGSADYVELEDRNCRFWMSLQRHKVPVSSDRMPLIVNRDHLATYLGVSEDELRDRWEVEKWYDGDVPEIEEYTPEQGFPAPNVLTERREHSHRKWAHFASRSGLPAWISPRFMQLVKDYFCFAPEHVKKRNQLIAAKKKYKFDRHSFTNAQRTNLERLKLMELSSGEICVFRCSPAQFAAIAVRDGEVLGEYFDSAHKAGRSKELYEAIRREWSADS